VSRYWRWLGDKLKLTLGGRIVFTFVAFVLGGLGAVAVIANGVAGIVHHGDREGGAPLVVLGIWIGALLLAVIAADAVFRATRRGIRHLRSRSQAG
jgi:hypothetical protein